MMNFYQLEIKDFPKLDLVAYTDENLRELSYFIWAMYPDDPGLMQWRELRLLPLIRVESIMNEED